jgi:D-alanine-D-alanine ligase-like ATP-grasp enzyme
MLTMNDLDNDVVIIKINTPPQSTSVSLTTASCRFLDKGLNYIFFFHKKIIS